MSLSTQRLEYIDQLKGIAMLLVVTGHIIVFCGLGYENTFIRHITMMNMPLFYFLNGLVLKDAQGINKGTAKFLFSKAQQLLIPFFVWGGLITLYRNATYFEFLQNYWKFGYWYFIVLFEFLIIHVVLNLINQLINKKSQWWLDFCIFLCIWTGFRFIGKFIPEGVNIIIDYWQFSAYLPFFYLGTFFRRYKIIDKMSRHTSPVMTILLICLLPFYFLWRSRVSAIVTDLILPVNIILILLMTFYVYENESNMQNKRMSSAANLLGYIGRHTFTIYVLQFFLFKYIDFHDIFQPLYADHSYLLILLITVIAAILICYICILCEYILGKSRLMNYILFGKKFN